MEIALHILFVCTGNICRSPTAERLALAYAAQASRRGFTASSAGVRAVIGEPMHHQAALVLESLGGDSSDFSAQQFTPRLGWDADLVLTMTRAHRDRILELAPRLLRRTFTLTEAARLATDYAAQNFEDLVALRPQLNTYALPEIADPIGQSQDVFELVGSQIADFLPPIVELCDRPSA